MNARWADIMDEHDKKRPTVRPKVEPKKEPNKNLPKSDVVKDTKDS